MSYALLLGTALILGLILATIHTVDDQVQAPSGTRIPALPRLSARVLIYGAGIVLFVLVSHWLFGKSGGLSPEPNAGALMEFLHVALLMTLVNLFFRLGCLVGDGHPEESTSEGNPLLLRVTAALLLLAGLAYLQGEEAQRFEPLPLLPPQETQWL